MSYASGEINEVVYEDKSLFKAAGPVWPQKDRLKGHLSKNLRGVDKTATWSKSGYHGWMYGYGLHLTGIRNGFPVMFQVLPANVNERKVLDTKKDRLLEKGVRCIVADNGYVDKKRQVSLFAETEVLLLTPKTTLAEANALLGADPLYTAHKSLHGRQCEKRFPLNPSLICSANFCQSQARRNLCRCEDWRMFPLFSALVSCCCNSQC